MLDVMAVQTALAQLGLYEGKIDGINGPMTKEAIRAFQRINGLAPDGIAGPLTQAALNPDPLPGRDDDPPQAEPAHIKAIWPRQSEVTAFYGDVGQHQTSLILPFPMRIAWEPSKAITRFSIHEKVHDSAKACFERIADSYNEDRRAALGLDLFGGCLNVRKMRGGSNYSMHSWGIAIDFDPERNQLKWGSDRARLAQPDCNKFWSIWEDAGWVSLGRARNYDWMHIQAARL